MMFKVEAEVDTSDIVYEIARDDGMIRNNYEGLLQFFIDIDMEVCDLQFTKALRNELNEIIAREEDQ